MPGFARSTGLGRVLVAALIAAGCSQGAPASTSASSGAAPTAAQSASAATSSPSASTAIGGAGIGAGGGSTKWCLNTNDEVTAAFGKAVTATTGADLPGTGGTCLYTAASQPVLIIAVYQNATPAVFGGLLNGQKFKDLSGIGDKAALASRIGPLAFQKGNTAVLLTIMPGVDMTNDAKIQSGLEQLAKPDVDRIP